MEVAARAPTCALIAHEVALHATDHVEQAGGPGTLRILATASSLVLTK